MVLGCSVKLGIAFQEDDESANEAMPAQPDGGYTPLNNRLSTHISHKQYQDFSDLRLVQVTL